LPLVGVTSGAFRGPEDPSQETQAKCNEWKLTSSPEGCAR
jgi:hypothetical protein